MSGPGRVHQLEVLVRRRAALSDGLRRGPGELHGQGRREPDVRGRAGRHRGGAVHGHRGGGGGVPAVQVQAGVRRGRPAGARAAQVVGRIRPVRGRRQDALRQAVPGAEWRRGRRRRRAGQAVPVVVRRPLPGVQGQHVLTRRRRRRATSSRNDRLSPGREPGLPVTRLSVY